MRYSQQPLNTSGKLRVVLYRTNLEKNEVFKQIKNPAIGWRGNLSVSQRNNPYCEYLIYDANIVLYFIVSGVSLCYVRIIKIFYTLTDRRSCKIKLYTFLSVPDCFDKYLMHSYSMYNCRLKCLVSILFVIICYIHRCFVVRVYIVMLYLVTLHSTIRR